MFNFLDSLPPGTLLVLALLATVLMLGIFAVSVDGLIQRCRAIPAQVNGVRHALKTIQSEIEAAKALEASDLATVELLKQQIIDGEAAIEAKTKKFDDAKSAIGKPAVIVDQTIQPTFEAWLVLVFRSSDDTRHGGPLAEEWAAGRHFVVFAEDATNAGRRILARFPTKLGYSCAEPSAFPFLMAER